MSTLLEARGLGFAYPNRTRVLDDWNGAFVGGTMTAVTGPSGAGKSTLLYLLGLMVAPSSGFVQINSRPVSGLDDVAKSRLRSEAFGFVFQDAALDNTRTVIDNVIEGGLYRNADRKESQSRSSRPSR